ncbi:hypothetical protein BDY21DRAFT_53388 [Lineolata rhizophorae]|uniref:Uncharacterized protein n=1 Tax=Lineolata rhizophorae TaxID=578093 RepID=A0A6A6NXQ7_9PEZI|nr:hypothetical protein BDY21DRAFT_53388 [Lineolata rhizophorae]
MKRAVPVPETRPHAAPDRWFAHWSRERGRSACPPAFQTRPSPITGSCAPALLLRMAGRSCGALSPRRRTPNSMPSTTASSYWTARRTFLSSPETRATRETRSCDRLTGPYCPRLSFVLPKGSIFVALYPLSREVASWRSYHRRGAATYRGLLGLEHLVA